MFIVTDLVSLKGLHRNIVFNMADIELITNGKLIL